MRMVENAITDYVRQTRENVYVEVTPWYGVESNIPLGVSIHARSLSTGNELPLKNGKTHIFVRVPQPYDLH